MAVTLAELRLRAQQASDMVNTNEANATSGFITKSEWNYLINGSYAELYDILVGKFEDYYSDSSVVTVTSGNTIPLPATFYKLRGLDRSDSGSNGTYYTLKPFQFEQRNVRNDRNMYQGVWPDIRYRILGSNIILTPEDQANGTYKIWFVPKVTTLSADTDTIDGVNGWEEYIVVDAAIKALRKEETDVSVHMAQKQMLLARIEAMAANRDVGSCDRVTDVNSSGVDQPLLFRW